jgi:hypothetical protein
MVAGGRTGKRKEWQRKEENERKKSWKKKKMPPSEW